MVAGGTMVSEGLEAKSMVELRLMGSGRQRLRR